MESSRTHNAINNTVFGIIAAGITVVLNLVVRIIIVDYLGDQINGLHSLFLSTISVLSLVQMGFSTAMVIHLYKPVHEHDELLICQLLNYYRIIYRRVAWIFLVLGACVCVFLMQKLVTTTINMLLVRAYFMLFILSYFVNYSTYYKRSLLFAEQKNRISILATTMSEVIFRGIAILLIVLFKQYYLFLLMLICDYGFSNLWCAIYIDRHHPYIKKYSGANLPTENRKAVFKTIKPLMVNQISDTVQKAAQSILISLLLGNVAIVGYYGSYQLITSTIQLMMSQLGGAFTSGFGNLSAENDKKRLANAFLKFFFVVAFSSILLCCSALCCIQDVILFLFGQNFILKQSSVILIMTIVFCTIISIPVISVQNAMGLHRLDSKWMVVQAVSAVGLGYIGGVYWGMDGILMGLLIPMIILTLYAKGIIITRYIFSDIKISYFSNLILLLLRCIFVIMISLSITKYIQYDYPLLNAIVKGLTGFAVSFVLLCMVYARNKYFLSYFKKMVSLIWKKRKQQYQ